MKEFNVDINIEAGNWVKDLPRAEEIIKKAVIAALHASGIAGYARSIEVSVLLTNDESIQNLNRDYRHKDKPTNVLSFPLESFNAGEYSKVRDDIAIGDIIFALETIKSEALEQKKMLEHHLAHLSIHGALHLIGYDHEDDRDAEIMEALEIKILAELGISNPYEEA